MFSTKIRTTIAALATTFAVAVAFAPAAPAQVFRPDVMKRKAGICQNYKILYDQQVQDAIQIDGNPDGQNQSDADAAASSEAANRTHDNAQKAGCGWAA